MPYKNKEDRKAHAKMYNSNPVVKAKQKEQNMVYREKNQNKVKNYLKEWSANNREAFKGYALKRRYNALRPLS